MDMCYNWGARAYSIGKSTKVSSLRRCQRESEKRFRWTTKTLGRRHRSNFLVACLRARHLGQYLVGQSDITNHIGVSRQWYSETSTFSIYLCSTHQRSSLPNCSSCVKRSKQSYKVTVLSLDPLAWLPLCFMAYMLFFQQNQISTISSFLRVHTHYIITQGEEVHTGPFWLKITRPTVGSHSKRT